MSLFFTIAVVVLIFLIIFQIAKAAEYVAVLKGEQKSNRQQNKINAFLMISFLVLGLIGVYWSNELFYSKTVMPIGAASDHGEKYDQMFTWTIIITGIVFFVTQILLFWFAYRYQHNDNRKVYFFPHNNTLELIWTVVPAIALTVLVVIGLRNWFAMTSAAPKNAMEVEVVGKQFGWLYRYPGRDHKFGQTFYRVIDDGANNPLGQIWRDSAALNLHADPANFDDVMPTTLYLVKNRPVKMIINSRDVVHDVGLIHFRMKMDAVPGIPTTIWFTPTLTTKEMQEKTGNPNFQYEITCDQMCGNGHYSMRGVIVVVTQAEFDAWLSQQKPNYYAAFPEKDPANKVQVATPPTNPNTGDTSRLRGTSGNPVGNSPNLK
ncbi:cytochrome c oxidase subunit II [Ilyomonas limi]|uniref:cytochrome-c oxidase n=1 Tax=Ilyomonas limi TaxID=2575867 RepID=A0A4V5UV74_9BACT|nr:cytochrome c oxidase subunit II [Ilyomonas limi]TKK71963.1 cytochrome c oxidase subunit II [Ilyomonas limi]